MFLLASLLAFLNFRKPKQPVEGKQQQWKPAWQKLQWANAERERLEGEVRKLREPRIPAPSWVRFIKAEPEITRPSEPGKLAARHPQKARCEFLNCIDIPYKLKVLSWDGRNNGLDAGFVRQTLQLRIVNDWCPIPDGVEELHIPPRESFRFWLFPRTVFNDEQFKARVALGNLGTVHFWINGQEIVIPVDVR